MGKVSKKVKKKLAEAEEIVGRPMSEVERQSYGIGDQCGGVINTTIDVVDEVCNARGLIEEAFKAEPWFVMTSVAVNRGNLWVLLKVKGEPPAILPSRLKEMCPKVRVEILQKVDLRKLMG
jgi:hypothetical protein